MSTINLYDILNLSSDCSTQDIKNSYRNLVKEYHPDKTNGDPEIFELITHAYNILVNNSTRAEYDERYNLAINNINDYFKLKQNANLYLKSQDTSNPNKNDFDKFQDEMNRKHGYNPDIIHKLDENELINRVQDIDLAREHDDIENLEEILIDNNDFNIDKFNAIYDAIHKSQNEIVVHNDNPLPYIFDNGKYTSIDNYSNLYVENRESTLFTDTNKKKLSKNEIKNLAPADYTRNHNLKDENYDSYIKEKIKKRNDETEEFTNMTFNDFITDNISSISLEFKDKPQLEWEDEDELQIKYLKLLEKREQNK